MLPGDVVDVLGNLADPAQFEPFVYPIGCVLRASAFFDGRVVRVQTHVPIRVARPEEAADPDRNTVARAYARAVNRPDEPAVVALETWLAAVERITGASARAIAEAGSVRLEAMPDYIVTVLREPSACGPPVVRVSFAGAKTRERDEVVVIGHATFGAVVGACAETIGPDVSKTHAFYRIVSSEAGVIDLAAPPAEDAALDTHACKFLLTTRSACAACGATIGVRGGTPAYRLTRMTDARVPRVVTCLGCPVQGAPLRSWQFEFTADARVPVLNVRRDAPTATRRAFAAVPAARASVWQHAAYVATWLRLLLRHTSDAGLLRLLPPEVLELVLSHLPCRVSF